MLENFSRGIFFGTTHTCLGQEANAVGVIHNLSDDDIVLSNHRGHGHFLAYGGDPRSLFAELMGKESGVCGGKGGSQHLHLRNFYSNGVQGGIVPVATGIALAEKVKKSGVVVVVFLGDGTLGEGVIYEAFNMASLWQAPILFVVENNRIAQTTPVESALAGDILERFKAFGIPGTELDSSDVLEISGAAQILLEDVRTNMSPRALVIHSHRFGPHSKGDDTRPKEVLSEIRAHRDPLVIHGKRIPLDQIRKIEKDVDTELTNAFGLALSDPLATAVAELVSQP